MVASLLTDRRVRSLLSGAVLTTWRLTRSKLEMIVDFRRNPPALPPLTIINSTVTAAESFRFLAPQFISTCRVSIHCAWCRWVRFEVRVMYHSQGHSEQICHFLQQQNVLAARCCCRQAENRGEISIRREKMMKMYDKCLQMESGMLNIDFFRGCVRRR